MTRDSTDNITLNRTTITKKQKLEEKQLYGYFKWQTNENSDKKTWTWLRKGKFMRESESLLIAAKNNTIRTNYIKAKIDKTQKKSKCRLCGDREKKINHIIGAKKSKRLGMTGWERWSTGSCARDWNLTIIPNGIHINKNMSWRMRFTKFSGILKYKRII